MFGSKVSIAQGVRGKLLNNIGELEAILLKNNGKGLLRQSLRLDLVRDAFAHKRTIYFVDDFPLALLSRRRQGWTEDKVLAMANSLLAPVGIEVKDMGHFNKHTISVEILDQIKEHFPPIIVSSLPDKIFHVEDGNHRAALAEFFLRMDNIPAIVIV